MTITEEANNCKITSLISSVDGYRIDIQLPSSNLFLMASEILVNDLTKEKCLDSIVRKFISNYYNENNMSNFNSRFIDNLDNIKSIFNYKLNDNRHLL